MNPRNSKFFLLESPVKPKIKPQPPNLDKQNLQTWKPPNLEPPKHPKGYPQTGPLTLNPTNTIGPPSLLNHHNLRALFQGSYATALLQCLWVWMFRAFMLRVSEVKGIQGIQKVCGVLGGFLLGKPC